MALIVVSGAIANKLGQGGEAWVRLSYVLGLRRLGFRVHFIEQIAASTCIDANGSPAPFEDSANRDYFARVMENFGLASCATLLPVDKAGKTQVPPELLDLAESASALLNISGHLEIKPLMNRFRNRVFIDIDPGFTQFWHAEGNPGVRLAGHHRFFTIGENIGAPSCSIPTGNIPWRHTRPPVVLSEWPVLQSSDRRCFTTVANWRGSYGAIEFGEKSFGAKAHEFRKVLELPRQTGAAFELALNIHPGDHKDRAALKNNGWNLVDPFSVAATPDQFRHYVQNSGAEFSVAQGVYVATSSGWVSDRTTRYLASAKPVLVQDTGWSRNYPAGQGLVTFRTLDEAVQGVQMIVDNYAEHAQAARALAEHHFDSDRVLGQLLDQIDLAD